MEDKKIVILGGSTAGLLTALWVRKNIPNADIKVIDDKNKRGVGVGESTTLQFRSLLNELEIDISKYIHETDATIKNGISFIDWNGDGKSFFHPFGEDIADLGENNNFINQKEVYLKHLIKNQENFDDYVYCNYITNKDKVDLTHIHWALHIDNQKSIKFFEKICVERNIEIVFDVFRGVKKDKDNCIKTIICKNQNYKSDFVFDCSGLSSVINKNVYKSEWEDFYYIPTNRAITFSLEVEEKIKPYTECTAMDDGWMWKIPTRNRIGGGYVFSDKYSEDDDIIKQINNYYGDRVEIGKKISFYNGCYKNIWNKNCVSLGLSSGFIEPLEATGLLIFAQQLILLQNYINRLFTLEDLVIKNYNQVNYSLVRSVSEFICLHYYTSKRMSGNFWKEYKNIELPQDFIEQFNLLKSNNMNFYDLFYHKSIHGYSVENYIHVAYGKEFIENNESSDNRVSYNEKEYKNTMKKLDVYIAKDHKKTLNKISEEVNKRDV